MRADRERAREPPGEPLALAARELDEAAGAVHARGLEIVRVEAERRDELHDQFAGELRGLLAEIVRTRAERGDIVGEQDARARAAVNDVRLQSRDVWARAASLTEFCKRARSGT